MPSKILLAEDDELTRFMMCEMLDELDFEYDVCTNGEDATRMITDAANDYSMVLMDIHMPRKTGLEATRDIRLAKTHPPRDIHIVAVTADQHWQNPTRSINAGFSDVMPKPVSIATLKDSIDRVLAA